MSRLSEYVNDVQLKLSITTNSGGSAIIPDNTDEVYQHNNEMKDIAKYTAEVISDSKIIKDVVKNGPITSNMVDSFINRVVYLFKKIVRYRVAPTDIKNITVLRNNFLSYIHKYDASKIIHPLDSIDLNLFPSIIINKNKTGISLDIEYIRSKISTINTIIQKINLPHYYNIINTEVINQIKFFKEVKSFSEIRVRYLNDFFMNRSYFDNLYSEIEDLDLGYNIVNDCLKNNLSKYSRSFLLTDLLFRELDLLKNEFIPSQKMKTKEYFSIRNNLSDDILQYYTEESKQILKKIQTHILFDYRIYSELEDYLQVILQYRTLVKFLTTLFSTFIIQAQKNEYNTSLYITFNKHYYQYYAALNNNPLQLVAKNVVDKIPEQIFYINKQKFIHLDLLDFTFNVDINVFKILNIFNKISLIIKEIGPRYPILTNSSSILHFINQFETFLKAKQSFLKKYNKILNGDTSTDLSYIASVFYKDKLFEDLYNFSKNNLLQFRADSINDLQDFDELFNLFIELNQYMTQINKQFEFNFSLFENIEFLQKYTTNLQDFNRLMIDFYNQIGSIEEDLTIFTKNYNTISKINDDIFLIFFAFNSITQDSFKLDISELLKIKDLIIMIRNKKFDVDLDHIISSQLKEYDLLSISEDEIETLKSETKKLVAKQKNVLSNYYKMYSIYDTSDEGLKKLYQKVLLSEEADKNKILKEIEHYKKLIFLQNSFDKIKPISCSVFQETVINVISLQNRLNLKFSELNDVKIQQIIRFSTMYFDDVIKVNDKFNTISEKKYSKKITSLLQFHSDYNKLKIQKQSKLKLFEMYDNYYLILKQNISDLYDNLGISENFIITLTSDPRIKLINNQLIFNFTEKELLQLKLLTDYFSNNRQHFYEIKNKLEEIINNKVLIYSDFESIHKLVELYYNKQKRKYNKVESDLFFFINDEDRDIKISGAEAFKQNLLKEHKFNDIFYTNLLKEYLIELKTAQEKAVSAIQGILKQTRTDVLSKTSTEVSDPSVNVISEFVSSKPITTEHKPNNKVDHLVSSIFRSYISRADMNEHTKFNSYYANFVHLIKVSGEHAIYPTDYYILYNNQSTRLYKTYYIKNREISEIYDPIHIGYSIIDDQKLLFTNSINTSKMRLFNYDLSVLDKLQFGFTVNHFIMIGSDQYVPLLYSPTQIIGLYNIKTKKARLNNSEYDIANYIEITDKTNKFVDGDSMCGIVEECNNKEIFNCKILGSANYKAVICEYGMYKASNNGVDEDEFVFVPRGNTVENSRGTVDVYNRSFRSYEIKFNTTTIPSEYYRAIWHPDIKKYILVTPEMCNDSCSFSTSFQRYNSNSNIIKFGKIFGSVYLNSDERLKPVFMPLIGSPYVYYSSDNIMYNIKGEIVGKIINGLPTFDPDFQVQKVIDVFDISSIKAININL